MKTFTSTQNIEGVSVRFESEVVNGEKMDTKVFFDDSYICTIAGDSIGDFIRDLKGVIDNYRI